jgi:hypothetical protein
MRSRCTASDWMEWIEWQKFVSCFAGGDWRCVEVSCEGNEVGTTVTSLHACWCSGEVFSNTSWKWVAAASIHNIQYTTKEFSSCVHWHVSRSWCCHLCFSSRSTSTLRAYETEYGDFVWRRLYEMAMMWRGGGRLTSFVELPLEDFNETITSRIWRAVSSSKNSVSCVTNSWLYDVDELSMTN